MSLAHAPRAPSPYQEGEGLRALATRLKSKAESRALVKEGIALGYPLVHGWIEKIIKGRLSRPEVATSIVDACNQDPLWPDAYGPLRTASLLTVMASRSNYNPGAISPDRIRFGLYQVELDCPDADAMPLLIPTTAAFVAIELIRQSLASAFALREHLDFALCWYDKSPEERMLARRRLVLAANLCREQFPCGARNPQNGDRCHLLYKHQGEIHHGSRGMWVPK